LRLHQRTSAGGFAMSDASPTRLTFEAKGSTKVVMLGTGTPRPDPERAGPAIAIVVNDTPYLVDFGAGVIRRAMAAYERGIDAFGYAATNVKTVFLTHLHSDHTIGYPDLIFTPWVMGRHEPLSVYGPRGLKAMTESILNAWRIDIDARTSGLNRHNPTGYKVKAHEIAPGVVYRDRNVTITAFSARHEEMVDSFGYRFETSDRSIVISGDTAPTQALIDHGRGCDVLIHEAYSMMAYRNAPRPSPEFRRRHHTSSIELAEIANTVKPGLLVTYHRSHVGEESSNPCQGDVLIEELSRDYKGRVVAARDLDVF
jgi:ribonuclease BN (tRNA processing enzyme)